MGPWVPSAKSLPLAMGARQHEFSGTLKNCLNSILYCLDELMQAAIFVLRN